MDNLGLWHPVTYFLKKIILIKIRYKIHNDKLLFNIKVFKTWKQNLKSCKHKILILINQNNLYHFMDIKNLSSRQIWWAKKLFKYDFQIDYHHGKANGAVDSLSQFFQRSQVKKDKLQAKNTQILHKLQSFLTNASLLGLASVSYLSTLGISSSKSNLTLLHQVYICKTHI